MTSIEEHRPQLLVNAARSTIRVATEDLIGTWPRTAAFLGRQALELSLERFWQERAPGVEDASMRAQLICLPTYADEDMARRVRYVWHALSRACHRHAYELSPTGAELNGWLDEVEAFVGR